MERTCALIKPDILSRKLVGKVISMIEENGFEIVEMKKLVFTRELVEKFYAVHADKPFFKGMVDAMSDKPIVALVLEKEDAIKAWRDLMGATNPANAKPGTIRATFGIDIEKNSTHGSDSVENARKEISLMFPELAV